MGELPLNRAQCRPTKGIAFLLWQAPWRNPQTLEWFDLVLAGSAFEGQWGLFVLGEGFLYGAPSSEEGNPLRRGGQSLKVLKYAEKGEIILCQEAARRCSEALLQRWFSLPNVKSLPAVEMRTRLQNYAHVLGG